MSETEILIGVMIVLVVILWMILFYSGMTILEMRKEIQREIQKRENELKGK